MATAHGLERPKNLNELEYLLQLKYKPELALWNVGYDSSGKWSPSQVELAAPNLLQKRSKTGRKKLRSKVDG